MNAYIVGDDHADCHMLVFARTAQEARKISYGYSWCDQAWSHWVDWRARRLKDLPKHLIALDNGNPQVVDDPPTCAVCERWGGHLLAYGCSLCNEPEPPVVDLSGDGR